MTAPDTGNPIAAAIHGPRWRCAERSVNPCPRNRQDHRDGSPHPARSSPGRSAVVAQGEEVPDAQGWWNSEGLQRRRVEVENCSTSVGAGGGPQ
jgi:hypothetical protein